MHHRSASFTRAVCALLLCAPLGCEEEKPAAPPAAVPSAEPAAATVAPKEEVKEEEPKEERPKNVPLELTGERRSAVEKAHPEAKGFLFAGDIEEKLKKDTKNSSKTAALKSFDKTAKGKWVLFTGTLVNPTDTGFDLAVTYTPLDPRDRMGISRQFFTVSFSEVAGYSKDAIKVGNTVAVVAKYKGEQAAGPGFELVAEKSWQ